MPKSRVRKKKVYTPPADIQPSAAFGTRKRRPSPRWLPATAVLLILLGVIWLVVYYMSSGLYPVESLRYWNLAIGFGAMVVSLGILTQWR